MDNSQLRAFAPATAAWFADVFGAPTDVQIQAWRQIRAGSSTLIAAPTGSGKTIAALLPCLDRVMVAKRAAGPAWTGGVRILYVTPLKALNNDIHGHLFRFAAQIRERAEREEAEAGEWPEIRIAVRTGDTTQATRASMLKSPPDVLVTTPESLYLLLGSRKGRDMLQTTEHVIVDEIHSLAADKRGVHLSLSLERLTELTGRPLQRIGVSATQKPLERVARYLGGWEHDAGGSLRERPVAIVNSAMDKTFALQVTMPRHVKRSAADKEKVWTALVERLLALMEGSRTTLVFVNNRRLSERLTLRLNDHVGGEIALAHHGSVSRERRLEVERRLKDGELRCVVATASLELGIDIGHVDLVIQIDSPKQAAAGIQRIGRAGHGVGGVSRGAIVARSRGELAEAAVLARRIAARDIEPIRVPHGSLDVVSQHIVAMVATGDWEIGRMHRVLTRSECYRGYPREKLEAALQVLAGYYPFVRPLIEWDRETNVLRHRANTSMAALTGVGTIPQSSSYPVHHAETRQHIGELDEEFVHESGVGDVVQLGASSWMIRDIKPDRLYVTPAANTFSEIPFWKADTLGRSVQLGEETGKLFARLGAAIAGGAAEEQEAISLLTGECFFDADAAEALLGFVRAQAAVCPLPTDKRIVIERFSDETGKRHIVIHSLFGRRLNRTLLLALQTLAARTTAGRVYANARDNGIELIVPPGDGLVRDVWSDPLRLLDRASVRELLLAALPASAQFAATFRRLAETSLLLARSFKRAPAWLLRHRGEELMRAALPFAEQFPYVREALEECLREQLDAEGLDALLAGVAAGDIEVAERATLYPSPFASQFFFDFVSTALYEADGFAADVQAQLAGVSRKLAAEWFGEAQARETMAPDIVAAERKRLEQGEGRSADSPDALLRLLKERGDLTEAELIALCGRPETGSGDGASAGDESGGQPAEWLARLEAAGKVDRRTIGGDVRFISRDERETYDTLEQRSESAEFVLKRHIDHRLSFSPAELRARYGLTAAQVDGVIAGWTERAAIERAPFAEADETDLWTSAAVASRIVRLSLQSFRRRLAPVEAERFCAELAHLHRIGAAGGGSESALLQALDLLQGVFLPLSHWETLLLPGRLPRYRKEELDELVSSGELRWLGRKEEGEKEGRIAFFRAEDDRLILPYLRQAKPPTRHADLLALLQAKGPSFLSALSRDYGAPPSVVLEALLALVWEGRVANDRFAPLRAAAAPKRQTAEFRSGLGRWYAVELPPADEESGVQEALAWARHLLRQQAVVTKEAAALVSPYSWDTLVGVYKRLEEWGMAARGLFVEGAGGLQFASSEAVARLRAPLPAGGDDEFVVLSAVDPANPYGLSLEWPKASGASFARKPGHYIVLRGGKWLLWIEQYGKHIVTMADGAEPESLEDGLRGLFREMLRQRGLRKVTVAKWNGRHAAESDAAPLLKRLGAEQDRDGYVLWPSDLR
ncbi:MAG: DEAD/DEAH box helicase [Paenibacillaceae bacterium]|nr:DEAD/DEAH box helicase [Paenibacillaceae bacterium]